MFEYTYLSSSEDESPALNSSVPNGYSGTMSYDNAGGGELLAEYAANASASSPQKEYGYRNGQLLITAAATATASGYVGCFTDDSNRALPALLGTGETVESCKQQAASAGYLYAGLQWYGEC